LALERVWVAEEVGFESNNPTQLHSDWVNSLMGVDLDPLRGKERENEG